MKDFATYFNERLENAEFANAYKEERKAIDDFDRAVRPTVNTDACLEKTNSSYVTCSYDVKEKDRQRMIPQINTEGMRRHTVSIIDIDLEAEEMTDRIVEDRVQGITIKRKLPVPRKLSEADMAQATEEAKTLHVKLDLALDGMERIPSFGIRFL